MKEFKYDITVIIPVYNSEEYLESSILSIIHQTHPFNKVQLCLINDGSKDSSLVICEKYAKKYSNVTVINKENAGVSAARNDGINNAEGKYLLLLDADDFLSPITLHNLYRFFEKHYGEIDLVTYPLYTCTGRRKKLHRRYLYYDKGTGIYDLDKYPHINQATVNIMLKNFEKLPRYDTTMKLAEDQKFNIMCLANKKKIGFCKHAAYNYRKHGGGVSDTRNNPLYCYESIMQYNEFLANNLLENGFCYKYVQSYILSTIAWRLKSDQLLPNHLGSEALKAETLRLKKLLSKIENSSICEFPYFEDNIKTYILKLKGSNIDIKYNSNNSYEVSCENNTIVKDSTVPAMVHRFHFLNNKLCMVAYLDTVLFEESKPKMYMQIHYKTSSTSTQEIALRDSTRSLINDNQKLGNVYAFDLAQDIQNVSNIEFYIEINDIKYPLNFTFPKKRNHLCYGNNKVAKCLSSKIKIASSNFFTKIYEILKYSNYNTIVMIYKGLYTLYINPSKVWLYSDSKGVIDNAYYQFKHDISKEDGIKRYYVIFDGKSFKNEKFTKEERRHLIKYKSFKHKMLFFHAEKILSSFSNATTYSPYGKSTLKYEDIIGHEFIYLQHGILHASLLRMYSKDYSHIDKIVVSSNFEVQNLILNYGYLQNDLLQVGMPRFAESSIVHNATGKIIYAPSWRKYLIGNLVDNSRKEFDDRFLASTFYTELDGLIKDKDFNNLLKVNNLTLDIKLHPIFKCYQKLFDISSESIVLNFDKIKLDDYNIFITDFSSFQFDFVMLKRPIVYFVPDITEFKAGLHTYRKLDLNYDEAFGKLCTNKNDLITELRKIISDKYILNNEYKERIDNFFIPDINNSQSRLYDKLIK